MDIDDAQYEAIVTSSARTAAYLAAGWTMPAINSTEFARSGQGRSYSTSTIWVTGRYLLSSCQLTLPGAHSLKPHPELQAAVDRALAEQDPVRCTQKLDAVWQCYGHVYVDSVEMGGMCHLTSAVTASEQVCNSTMVFNLISLYFTVLMKTDSLAQMTYRRKWNPPSTRNSTFRMSPRLQRLC